MISLSSCWGSTHSALGPNMSGWLAGTPAVPVASKPIWEGRGREKSVRGGGRDPTLAFTARSHPWWGLRKPDTGLFDSLMAK